MTFHYHPLDTESKAFRLIRLFPGVDHNIECELFEAWLDDPNSLIPYETLSYTWGSTEKSRSIQVNGHDFKVTNNLYVALYYLRLAIEDRIFWVDAICINQSELSELSHQVHHMADIYEKSVRVVVWLGPATLESNLIMAAMKQLQMQVLKDSYYTWEASDERWSDAWRKAQRCIVMENEITIPEQYKSMLSLLDRDWFRRVWILQEVASARNSLIVCGAKEISGRIFVVMPKLLGITAKEHCQAVLRLFSPNWKLQERTLWALLVSFRQSQTTDPKDMVYALLGLSSDAYQSDFLNVDYGKSLEQIIAETISFILSLHTLGYKIQSPAPWCQMPNFQDALGKSRSAMLNWAISHDDELAKYLSPISPPTMGSPEGLLLLSVLSRGNRDGVKKLLMAHHDIDVNVEGEFGPSPLIFASGRGYEEIVEILAKRRDVNMNSRDYRGRTAIMEAATYGHLKTAEILLECEGINVNCTDHRGRTAIMEAATHGNLKIAEILLECEGINVNCTDDRGRTAIMGAAAHGHANIVEKLLECEDINVNCIDDTGSTAIIRAVEAEYLETVRILLRHKNININCTND